MCVCVCVCVHIDVVGLFSNHSILCPILVFYLVKGQSCASKTKTSNFN